MPLLETRDGGVQEFTPANKRYVVVVEYMSGGGNVRRCDWFETDMRFMAIAVFDALVKDFRRLVNDVGVRNPWSVIMYLNKGTHWRVTVDLGIIVNVEPLDCDRILGREYDPERPHD